MSEPEMRMIERVGRLLCRRFRPELDPAACWTMFWRDAQAVFAEIREPTEAMCDQVTMGLTGPDEHGGLAVTRSAAQTIWRAMIDEALTGSPYPSASAGPPGSAS